MFPDALKSAVEHDLTRHHGQKVRIERFKAAGGGCINSAGTLETSNGRFFIKWNDANRFPQMFDKEMSGLNQLRTPDVINVPAPILVGQAGTQAFIIMEHIEARPPNADYWEKLGYELAALHRETTDAFGLNHDNYIGSLPQYNSWKKDWISFFIINRLQPQLKMARDAGKAGNEMATDFERLYKKLPDLIPTTSTPALLHGDLWSGNLITNHIGEPVIIDPAVYYGDREIELAFTNLFGGFDRRFYASYQEAFPLTEGFDQRVDLYNLYPLMVHVNLFGGYYVNQVAGILARFR